MFGCVPCGGHNITILQISSPIWFDSLSQPEKIRYELSFQVNKTKKSTGHAFAPYRHLGKILMKTELLYRSLSAPAELNTRGGGSVYRKRVPRQSFAKICLKNN